MGIICIIRQSDLSETGSVSHSHSGEALQSEKNFNYIIPINKISYQMDNTIMQRDLDRTWGFCDVEHYGTAENAERIEKTFQGFGYDIIRARNLKADQIKSLLSEQECIQGTNTVPFTDYASLVFCFVGHGNEGVVFGNDGIPVSLNRIHQSVQGLNGKPKVFIVFTCQRCKLHQDFSVPSVYYRNNTMRTTAIDADLSNNDIDGNLHEPPIERHLIGM